MGGAGAEPAYCRSLRNALMGDAWFYHLTHQSVDQALGPLLNRCLQNNWRVLLRGTDKDRLTWLDEKLWLGPEDGFLPHGLSGGAHDSNQPVLLALQGENHPHDCLICIDGADVAEDEVRNTARTCIIFDGADQASLHHAREQWKALTGAGVQAQYWSQESGRWELKAKSK